MTWSTFGSLERYRDHGLLILRVGLGLMMLTHGVPKLAGGPATWARVGRAMASLGVHAAPTWWGFAAACAETFGGLFAALGLLTRPAAALVAFTLAVAATNHLAHGAGLKGASHAIETGCAFVALVVAGPGRFSLDARLRR